MNKVSRGGLKAAPRLRLWHLILMAVLGWIALMLLWLVLAYGELPHLWSKHEHKKIGRRDEIISFTSQDIPADPINLKLVGNEKSIACAFHRAGWSMADPLSAKSAIGIVKSVVFNRSYPQAPVSSLYFQDRLQDLAFEKDEGRSAHRRHHVRLWQVAPGQWLGAATFDKGVGFALFTLQITHHIGAAVDAERDALGMMFERLGARYLGSQSSRIPSGKWLRNGGGDRYMTDGEIRAYALNSISC